MFSFERTHDRSLNPAFDGNDADAELDRDFYARRPLREAPSAAPSWFDSARAALLGSGEHHRHGQRSMPTHLIDGMLDEPSAADVRATQRSAVPTIAAHAALPEPEVQPRELATDSGAGGRIMRAHDAQHERPAMSLHDNLAFADVDSLDGASPDDDLRAMLATQRAPDPSQKPGPTSVLSGGAQKALNTAKSVGGAAADFELAPMLKEATPGHAAIAPVSMLGNLSTAVKAVDMMMDQAKDGEGIDGVDRARAQAAARMDDLKAARDVGGKARFRAGARGLIGGMRVAKQLRENKLGNTVQKEATSDQLALAADPSLQETSMTDVIGTIAQGARASGEGLEQIGLANIPLASNPQKYLDSGQAEMAALSAGAAMGGDIASASGVGAPLKIAAAAATTGLGNGVQMLSKERAEKQDERDAAREFNQQMADGTRGDVIARRGFAPEYDPMLDDREMGEDGAYRRTAERQAALAANPKALAGRQPLRPTEDPDKRTYAERMGDSAASFGAGARSFGSWLSDKWSGATDWFTGKTRSLAQSMASIFDWGGVDDW